MLHSTDEAYRPDDRLVLRVFVINAYRHVHEDRLKQLVAALRPYKPGRFLSSAAPKRRGCRHTARDELAPDAPWRASSSSRWWPPSSACASDSATQGSRRAVPRRTRGAQLGARQRRGKTLLNVCVYLRLLGGGARLGRVRAVNIDISRRVLDWGEDNAGSRAGGRPPRLHRRRRLDCWSASPRRADVRRRGARPSVVLDHANDPLHRRARLRRPGSIAAAGGAATACWCAAATSGR